MKEKHLNKSQGFTLIELTIVIIIASLLLAAGSSLFAAYLKKKQVTDTKDRLEEIHGALVSYSLAHNGKVPCPASRTIAEGGVGYGYAGEETDLTVDVACTEAALPDSEGIKSVGSGPDKVRIGSVPVANLGLSSDYMYDGYGRRFTYVVTDTLKSTLADSAILTADPLGGAPLANQVPYLIISHGADGKGGYTRSGVLYGGAACDAGSGIDEENCDGDDDVFVQTAAFSTSLDANHFDDFTQFSATDSLLSRILNCNNKGKIFSSTAIRQMPPPAPIDPNATADEDGCVNVGGGNNLLNGIYPGKIVCSIGSSHYILTLAQATSSGVIYDWLAYNLPYQGWQNKYNADGSFRSSIQMRGDQSAPYGPGQNENTNLTYTDCWNKSIQQLITDNQTL